MKCFGLIGKTLGHSWSKSFWTQRFQELELKDHFYEHYELNSIEELRELLKAKDILGLNVTVPYKESVISFLDELDESAEAIGAVNFIDLRDGKRKGYNFDWIGFQQSIRPFFEPIHERCLILGTGGSAKAVAFAMKSLGAQVMHVSRDPKPDQLGYDQLNEHVFRAFKMIVNCTPVGMHPKTEAMPPLSLEHLTPEHFVVDLIYNPKKTLLLSKSKEKGAMILNGEDMLRLQALAAMDLLGIG